jgi:hypothetical protein
MLQSVEHEGHVMLKFGVAAIVAALVVVSADRWAGQWFFELGSLLTTNEAYELIVANYAYKAFTWACLFAAVLIVTPEPSRNWPNALVCGLVLAVVLYQARELTIMTFANGQTPTFWWIATMVVFAPPLWLTWQWYKRLAGGVARSS